MTRSNTREYHPLPTRPPEPTPPPRPPRPTRPCPCRPPAEHKTNIVAAESAEPRRFRGIRDGNGEPVRVGGVCDDEVCANLAGAGEREIHRASLLRDGERDGGEGGIRFNLFRHNRGLLEPGGPPHS